MFIFAFMFVLLHHITRYTIQGSVQASNRTVAKSFLTPAHRPPVASSAPARIRHRLSIIPYAVCTNPKQCVPPHRSSHATASLMSCTPTSSSSQEPTKFCRGSEPNGACFWRLAAGFKSRRTRPCPVVGAQNPTARAFGGLPQASKVAERGPAPLSGLRTQRRVLLAACRRLQKSPNAALPRCRGSEPNGACFWRLAAGFKSRRTRPCPVVGAQNPTARAFGGLPQASKVAERGPAPLSGLRTQRRVLLAACRRLQKSPNAALPRCRGSEPNGACFWRLAAGFKSRRTRPCPVVGAQNPTARAFGGLPQASKVAERGPAPLSGLRTQRRVLLAACRRLQKSPNAALPRCRGSEPNGACFWRLAAGFKSRRTRPCPVVGAQNPTARAFGGLPQASKVAERGPAPLSGLRTQRRVLLAACRRLQKSPNAALPRCRGSEPNGACFWRLAAGFKSRRTRPCPVVGAQNPTARAFGGLPQASKVAERGPAPLSGLRTQRRVLLAACRRLQKSPNAALPRCRGSEPNGACFWRLAAGFKSRRTRPCPVVGAQNPTARAFGGLPQASKVAERGPAPLSGLRTQRRVLLAACRRLQKSPNAALPRCRGSEPNGACFWRLAAGFKSRRTRPCPVVGAQNPTARAFGGLPQASKVAERGPAPLSGLRTQRRVLLAACRRLQKSPNAALPRCRGSEPNGACFWRLAAGFKSRRTRPCPVVGAQNPTARAFGGLPQASKVAERGPAPLSGLRTQRRVLLAACRRLQKSPNAALPRCRGSEPNGACFWRLAAGFKSRRTRPCPVVGAQNPTARAFGGLPQASKVAERGPAPLSGLRTQRRVLLAACRRLQKSPNAALPRCRGSEPNGACFWRLAAGFKSRRTRPCPVVGAQNPTARAFGGLPQASKVAERGPAPLSGLRTQRRVLLAACRRLQKSPNAALPRCRGSEPNGACFWRLAAGFKSRRTRPCPVVGAQNPTARAFGGLPQASKVAERGPAPLSGLRTQRRVLLAACRRLQKSPNAALPRCRGSEPNGACFWRLAAGFKSRRTRPCPVVGAQNPTARAFGGLPQASKVAERGPAPLSGLRTQRRVLLAACRRLQKSPNAALPRCRGSEPNGACFWRLAAGFKSRRTRPCPVVGAQNPTARAFGGLPQASKVAERGPAPLSGLRTESRGRDSRSPE